MIKNNCLLLLLICLFSGCATVKEQHKRQCNYEAAYAQGIQDAQMDIPMSTDAAHWCDEKDKEVVRKAYRKGYTFALKHKKEKHVIHEHK